MMGALTDWRHMEDGEGAGRPGEGGTGVKNPCSASPPRWVIRSSTRPRLPPHRLSLPAHVGRLKGVPGQGRKRKKYKRANFQDISKETLGKSEKRYKRFCCSDLLFVDFPPKINFLDYIPVITRSLTAELLAWHLLFILFLPYISSYCQP